MSYEASAAAAIAKSRAKRQGTPSPPNAPGNKQSSGKVAPAAAIGGAVAVGAAIGTAAAMASADEDGKSVTPPRAKKKLVSNWLASNQQSDEEKLAKVRADRLEKERLEG